MLSCLSKPNYPAPNTRRRSGRRIAPRRWGRNQYARPMRPGRWQGSTERASMAKSTANYGNDSIRQLKDEERVRLRPAVIFGSDGLDG